jgi:hypothetical protein
MDDQEVKQRTVLLESDNSMTVGELNVRTWFFVLQ